jgi:hypothetical protein
MVQASTEVAESEAQGPLKTTYDEIKATLRTPIVPEVFRVLALEPDFLQVAWRQLRPNLQTTYFETRADEVRAMAVEAVRGTGVQPVAPDTEDARLAVRVFHYVNPKTFLALIALRSAVSGSQPKLEEISAAQKRQILTGVPDEAASVGLPATSSPEASDLDTQVAASVGGSTPPDEWRVLAQWPEYAERSWNAFRPMVDRPDFARTRRALNRMGEETVTALPYRMDVSPHVLRLIGLTEQQIDRVHALLRERTAAMPAVVLNSAVLALGVEGQAAANSPFPASLLGEGTPA